MPHQCFRNWDISANTKEHPKYQPFLSSPWELGQADECCQILKMMEASENLDNEYKKLDTNRDNGINQQEFGISNETGPECLRSS